MIEPEFISHEAGSFAKGNSPKLRLLIIAGRHILRDAAAGDWHHHALLCLRLSLYGGNNTRFLIVIPFKTSVLEVNCDRSLLMSLRTIFFLSLYISSFKFHNLF